MFEIISNNASVFKEFMGFIRLRVCLYVTSISIFGFLLFNPLGLKLFLVIFATFAATASMYSLNQLSDGEEDMINKKVLNRFVVNGKGFYIVISLLFFGLLFSVLLSMTSFLFLILSVTLGIIYSTLRIKRISSIKNIYAMISISLMFLVGATANSNSINSITTIDLIKVYLVLSIYILIISIMADLRDYNGDKLADIKTIPVMLGYNAGKRVIYLLFILFSILVVIENLISFYILLMFVPFILIYLIKDNVLNAYNLLSISFLSLPVSAFTFIMFF